MSVLWKGSIGKIELQITVIQILCGTLLGKLSLVGKLSLGFIISVSPTISFPGLHYFTWFNQFKEYGSS